MSPIAGKIRSALLLFVSIGVTASGEDLRLSDGRNLKNVRIVEVRPDALIVWHRDGVLMADFEKLPKPIRARYGYEPQKAAAFRKEKAAERQATAEENRQLLAAYQKRKVAAIQARLESGTAEASNFAGLNESELTYRPGAADRAYDNAVAYVSEEIAKAEEARIIEARKPDTFWNAPFWKYPIVQFLGSLLGGGGSGGGFNSEPRGWR